MLPINGRNVPYLAGYCANAEAPNPLSPGDAAHQRQKKEFSDVPYSNAATIADAPTGSQPLLEAVNAQFGLVPNMYRLIATSQHALEGHLGISSALGRGTLPAPTRERIALAVAEVNGCRYCLSAHTYIGKHIAKLDDAEMTANRSGASNEPEADVAVRFAAKVARQRGRIVEADLAAVRLAGYTDAQLLEIVQHVVLNIWTFYVNEIVSTDIDFPIVEASKAA